jgi:hypothetical protein
MQFEKQLDVDLQEIKWVTLTLVDIQRGVAGIHAGSFSRHRQDFLCPVLRFRPLGSPMLSRKSSKS